MPNRNQRRPADSKKPAADAAKDLWTPVELARYLEVSANTCYGLLARGEVPGAVRFGRHWRISVQAFMRSVHGETAQAS